MITTETLKEFLRKHPRIDLLQYILRKKIKSIPECRKMLEAEKSPLVVRFKKYGPLNDKTHIYHIIIDSAYKAMGYCSLLRATLLHLAYAEKMAFVPVVEWTDELLYTENNSKNETKNGFEYFFHETSEISLKELYESSMVATSKIYDLDLIVDKLSYCVQEHEIKILAEMIKKYLCFNDFGREEIDCPCKKLIGSKSILGVHVRGTDFKKEYSRHPVTITVDEYLDKAIKVFDENAFDLVFLATDEQEALNKFQNFFGETLVYHEALRSKDGNPLHYGGRVSRKNNKYLLGREILKDVYTLGHCDGLICGFSNVSIIARAIKESTGVPYRYTKVLNKGLNYNLKECSIVVKRS